MAKLVTIGGCSMYKHNVPSLIIEKHHIVPLSWWVAAGKPVDTPFAQLCPTCHMNVHWWLDKIIKSLVHGGPLPPLVPFRAYQLATKGIDLGQAAGLIPKGTL